MNENLWRSVRNHIRTEIPAADDLTWINPLRAHVHDDTLVIEAHNEYVAKQIKRRYLPRLQELAVEYSDPHQVVEKAVVKLDTVRHTQIRPRRAGVKVDKFSVTGLRDQFTFEGFVDGNSNEWAKNAALAVAQQPGKLYNPLLLYGDVGLGKTHLMHALGNHIHATRPDRRINCKYSQNFVRDMVDAIYTKSFKAINEKTEEYRKVDVLLIDDVQHFAGKEKSQEEFFHLFNFLEEHGCQMVFTCDRYPSEIGLDNRLSSRFVKGITAELKPPDTETRAAILIRKALEDEINLRDKVALHIAERVPTNGRELEGIWKTIYLSNRDSGYEISVDFVDRVLDHFINYRKPKVTTDQILQTVADFFKIRVADLQGKSRQSEIIHARHLAIYLARERTSLPLKAIGQHFGNRDHSSVKHACDKMRKLLAQVDSSAKRDYEVLVRKLSQ